MTLKLSHLLKIGMTFLYVWFASSFAFSNGSLAPELEIIAQAKSSAEYPILRQLQDLTLDLQLLEIAIKNRRDAKTEEKITTALQDIEAQGEKLGLTFKTARAEQLDGIYLLFCIAKRFSKMTGVARAEWDELFNAIRGGQLSSGTLSVHGKKGALNVLTFSPLSIGRQTVWSVSLPPPDKKSFWIQARAKGAELAVPRLSVLANKALEKKIQRINAPFSDLEKLTKLYFTDSYRKLYSAFETHRYAILQRIAMARHTLIELSKTNTSMGAPEAFSSLYNHTLENLFSYGIDVSLSGVQRDFAIKGFLFAETPERAEELFQKLKYTPSASSYNSPSS